MLTKERNDLLTLTGPGTPCGEMLRQYWQPIALAEEMKPGAPPLPVKIMHEELVVYRDDQGELGLLGLHCPHRGVDLSYGRIEKAGLRCLYHGWLFDKKGHCLEQPAEAKGSRFYEKIRHTAYPAQEKGGVIFAYLGKGEPPLIPDYPYLTVPEDYRLHLRAVQRCNWLQALEGSIDPSHVTFLHGVFDQGISVRDKRSGQLRDPFAEDPSPRFDIEPLPYGFRLYGLHQMQAGDQFLRVTNYLYPNAAAVVGNEAAQGAGGFSGRWYVPIDDVTHYRFELMHTKAAPIDKKRHRERFDREVGADHRYFRGPENRYRQNRDEMKASTFSGLGRDFAVQDLFAIETQGPIQDRTRENLSATDIFVASMRRAIGDAIDDVAAGRTPPGIFRSAAENDLSDMLVFRDYIEGGITGSDYCRRLTEGRKRAAE